MPEKAAGSGAFTLEVPIDASAISADDLKQQNLKVVVKPCTGEISSRPVELKADGSGRASFSFAKNPGAVSVLVGPDRAEDQELADSQTLTSFVNESMWAKRRVALEPIVISYWWWWWWWRWCREFTIHGRVVCANGSPVVGAEVCAYDVDWWWWWWSKQQVGCATTDATGTFDISFRWCCGFWPWWWWRYRVWEFQPEIAEAIVPALERDPRIQLGSATNIPSLDVFKPLLERSLDTSKPMAAVSAGQLDQVRAQLLEKLPAAPELAQLRIWPWAPWWPWWDCTPDIIFKVTQDCLVPGALIVDEGYAQTRWDIPDPLNVTLIANDLACCKPKPPCNTGDCIEIASFCSDEGIPLSDIGGNPGAAVGQPTGYYLGDRPFSGTVAVLKANDFAGVDYYGVEYWNTGVGDWTDLPAGAYEDFCRIRIHEAFPFPTQKVDFKWQARADAASKSHTVVESREHWDAANPWAPTFWEIGANLVVPIDSTKFPDGTYRFRVVGYQDDGIGKVKNGHVLLVCGTELENEWVLTFDNRIVPDPSVLNCGPPTVRVCSREPLAVLNAITIDGNPIPACGVTEINGNLVVDFEASDADGHLEQFALTVHYGAGIVHDLLGLPGASLTNIAADYVGPTYAQALVEGATSPTWKGGQMRLTVPASEAFPEPCCYLIRLEAWKRHVLGSALGNCGYVCTVDQYYNEDEFTVGAGVCDNVREIARASGEIAAATAPEATG